MDIGRSISYVFQDPQWIKKVAIGGLLLLIPILGWLIVLGYWLRNLRQSAQGVDLPLPEWDDFGGDLVRGLKAFATMFIWYLPVTVLSFCVLIATGGGTGDAGANGLAFLGNCLTFILSLAITFFAPLILSRVATTEDIGAGLDFSGVINEARQHPVPLLIALAVTYALGFASLLGLIACFIGVFFTYFLAYVMVSHLYGQIRRQIDGGDQAQAVTQAPTV